MSNRPLTAREVKMMFDASDRTEWNRQERELEAEMRRKETQASIRELYRIANRMEELGR